MSTKTIHKRLAAELERRRQLAYPSNYDPREELMQKLNAMAERIRASPDWPPDPMPTVEEVKQHLHEILAVHEEPQNGACGCSS